MRKLKPIYIVIMAWLLFMVIESLKKNGLFTDGPYFLYQYLPGLLIWILITLPSQRLFNRTADFTPLKRVLAFVFFGILLGGLKNVLSWLAFFIYGVSVDRYSLEFESLGIFYSKITLFYYMESIIIAWVMLIVFFVLELYQNFKQKSLEAAELESQLAKAQLESLRMQLQPHFLFNAHNTVSMLIRTKKYDQATEMISKISELLRNSLNSQESQLVPVSREFELIKAYLEIEEIRFEDHLSIRFEQDEAADDCLIPHLLLQPLIENAFKHGVSKNLGESNILIKSVASAEKVLLVVHNTGPSLPEEWDMDHESGIGLSNTKQRLTKIYGEDQFSFEVINEANGVSAIVKVPKKTKSDG